MPTFVMTSPRRVEQKAELRIYGASHGVDFEPGELSRRLGITAHTTWRRGEVLRSGRVRANTVWWWQTEERTEIDSEVLVCEVLTAFEPVAATLARSRAEWDLDLKLGLVVNMYGVMQVDDDGSPWADVPTPGLAFSLDIVDRLARLNCSIDIDQYVYAPDDE